MCYSTNRDDHYVRVCAIKFLCLLDESNTLHKKFIEVFVIKLLDKVRLHCGALSCIRLGLGSWAALVVADSTSYPAYPSVIQGIWCSNIPK